MQQITAQSLDEAQQGALRRVLDKLGDKWTFLIFAVLEDRPRRFNQIKREIGDISQRVLSMRLHDLERDGYVSRRVHPSTPPRVEYALTEIGCSVLSPVGKLLSWALESSLQIEESRRRYDLARLPRDVSG